MAYFHIIQVSNFNSKFISGDTDWQSLVSAMFLILMKITSQSQRYYENVFTGECLVSSPLKCLSPAFGIHGTVPLYRSLIWWGKKKKVINKKIIRNALSLISSPCQGSTPLPSAKMSCRYHSWTFLPTTSTPTPRFNSSSPHLSCLFFFFLILDLNVIQIKAELPQLSQPALW